MSLASVQAFLEWKAPGIRVLDLEKQPVARRTPIAPGQIAKSLLLNVGSVRVMLVMPQDTRLDPAKCRATFNVRPKLLAPKVVEASTGHSIDAVTPIGMACRVPIYFDLSIRLFEDIYLPAGAPGKILKIPVGQLAELVKARWVDIGRPVRTHNDDVQVSHREYALA